MKTNPSRGFLVSLVLVVCGAAVWFGIVQPKFTREANKLASPGARVDRSPVFIANNADPLVIQTWRLRQERLARENQVALQDQARKHALAELQRQLAAKPALMYPTFPPRLAGTRRD